MTDSNKFKYEYKDPLDFGYIKIKNNKITKPKGSNIGSNFGSNERIRRKLFVKTEIYYNEELNMVKVQYLNSLLAKIVFPFLVPVILVLSGLSPESIKELIRETKRFYNEKKTGSFTSDVYYDKECPNSDGPNYVSVIRDYVKSN